MAMSEADDLRRENASLRERLTRLSEASLLVNDSLDFSTVLQEVVRNASSLTGARYGGMSLLDESGAPEDFVSHGLTPEEHQLLLDLPDRVWPEFINHFSDIGAIPVRGQDRTLRGMTPSERAIDGWS